MVSILNLIYYYWILVFAYFFFIYCCSFVSYDLNFLRNYNYTNYAFIPNQKAITPLNFFVFQRKNLFKSLNYIISIKASKASEALDSSKKHKIHFHHSFLVANINYSHQYFLVYFIRYYYLIKVATNYITN